MKMSFDELDKKLEACQANLRQLERVLVAFSGGVDSTFLLALAAQTLTPANVLAVVGVSPSLPGRELNEVRKLAATIGVELVEVATEELNNPDYAANPARRCFFCKHDLFSRLTALARQRGCAAVLSGANADDTGDFRPGLAAGKELGVRNPLLEAGLSKVEIRALSRRMELPTWDKPAMACLASRVPYDSPITAARLARIEQAENCLRDLGFGHVRVRDHDTLARIEVPMEDLERLLAMGKQVVTQLKAAGYIYVTADLAGLRSGSSNEALGLKPAKSAGETP
jgi:pyridinium-3,5-biscarboxylic acid mononucleotide sulfurtransferase